MKTPIPARPRKRLGQNFLCDENILEKIVRFIAPSSTDIVLEIGAGTGALTARIAPLVKRLYAVEIDANLQPYLQKIPNVEIVSADVLSLDVCSFCVENEKLRVIGNLPYYISTPTLTALLRQRHCMQDMVLMFQDEVARRITASPGEHDYSYLSVIAQYFSELTKGFKISRQCFVPRPEIESRIVSFRVKPNTALDYEAYSSFVQIAFSQRRKKLRNNLLRSLSLSAGTLDAAMQQLDIPADARAENLSAGQYEQLILTLKL